MRERKRSRRSTASGDSDREEEQRPRSDDSRTNQHNKKPRLSALDSSNEPPQIEQLETLRRVLLMVQSKKLSPRNAFTSVDMDAALAELHEESRASRELNFSMLGMSLDASSRVYGCRVENTYLACMNFAANFKSCSGDGIASEMFDEDSSVEVLQSENGAPKSREPKPRSRHNAFIVEDKRITKPLVIDLDLVSQPSGILARTNEADNSLGRIASFLPPSDVYAPDLFQDHSWYDAGPLTSFRTNNPALSGGFNADAPLLLLENEDLFCYDSRTIDEEEYAEPPLCDDEYDFEAYLSFNSSLRIEVEEETVPAIENDRPDPTSPDEVPISALEVPTQTARVQLTEATLINWGRFNNFIMKGSRWMDDRELRQLFLLPAVLVEPILRSQSLSDSAQRKTPSPSPTEPTQRIEDSDSDPDPFAVEEYRNESQMSLRKTEERDSSIGLSEAFAAKPRRLPYSKRARIVNMKEIKGKVMEILEREWNDGNSDIIFFSEVYDRLQTVLTASSRKDLNFQIAFLALLSLANDEKLNLESATGSDVIISKLR